MQEINLYQPVSKGVRGALSARSSLTILIVIAATLSGLWGFGTWQLGRLQASVEVVRNQQAAQLAMAAAHGPQLDALSDEELDALVASLGGTVDLKSRALAMLSGETAQRGAGFAARMRAFAVRHIDGIWLDRLTFGASADSISISGSTLTPDNVPRYLRSLATDPALKGGQIDEFIIEKARPKADNGRLSFRAGRRGLMHVEAKNAEDGEIT